MPGFCQGDEKPHGELSEGMRVARSRCGSNIKIKIKDFWKFEMDPSIQTISQAVNEKSLHLFRFIIHRNTSLFKPVSVSINTLFIYYSDSVHLNLAGRISRYGLPRLTRKKKVPIKIKVNWGRRVKRVTVPAAEDHKSPNRVENNYCCSVHT